MLVKKNIFLNSVSFICFSFAVLLKILKELTLKTALNYFHNFKNDLRVNIS